MAFHPVREPGKYQSTNVNLSKVSMRKHEMESLHRTTAVNTTRLSCLGWSVQEDKQISFNFITAVGCDVAHWSTFRSRLLPLSSGRLCISRCVVLKVPGRQNTLQQKIADYRSFHQRDSSQFTEESTASLHEYTKLSLSAHYDSDRWTDE